MPIVSAWRSARQRHEVPRASRCSGEPSCHCFGLGTICSKLTVRRFPAIQLERDLWILMSELATAVENRHKLVADQTLVTSTMIERLEETIDAFSERFDPPTEFVVPGQTRTAALLDVARTVVRRAERQTISVAPEGSLAVAYLNRLSDLLWTLARWQEGSSLPSKS